MSKRAPFKYSKWKLSSQMDSGTFLKIITRKLKIKKIQSYNGNKRTKGEIYTKLTIKAPERRQ